MGHISIFSNRVYDFDEKLNTDIQTFNSLVWTAYNRLYDMKYCNLKLKGSIHTYMQSKNRFKSYYTNSIVQIAKAKLKAQEELNKLYIDEKKEKLKSIEDKLKEKEEELENLRFEYTEIENFYKEVKKIQALNLSKKEELKKIKKLKFKNHISFVSLDIEKLEFRVTKVYKKKVIVNNYSIHEFQFGYLVNKIRQIKSIISKLKYARNNLITKINNLKKKPKRLFWGSKKLINQRFEYSDLNIWKNNLNNKRFKELKVSGRHDAKYGNFVFKYDSRTQSISFELMTGEEIKVNNIYFPYKGELLNQILLDRKAYPIPIEMGYRLKFDKKQNKFYIVFSASFDVSKLKRYNDSVVDGVIGLDINFGHLDLTDISSDGNLLDTKTIYFDITNNSKQNEINLKKAVIEAGEYIASKKKPLIKEELSFKSLKDKCKYENKALNRMIHSFPTERINYFLEQEKDKHEFEIFEINPAYTSIIGKNKYAEDKKLNNHVAASFVIGRRALNFKENIPSEYKEYLDKNTNLHNLNTWRSINKYLNK